jgi:multiple sugar transport system permease protein
LKLPDCIRAEPAVSSLFLDAAGFFIGITSIDRIKNPFLLMLYSLFTEFTCYTPKKGDCMKRLKRVFLGNGSEPGLYFIIPSFCGVLIFTLIPFMDIIRRSFYNAMGVQHVGIGNFRTVLSNDAFRQACGNTARFLCVCLPLLLGLSLLLAVMLYAIPKRSALFKTTFLFPMAIPVATIVLLWQVLFAYKGFANHMLNLLGAQPIDWMNSDAAFGVLIFSYIWKNIGYAIVLWMAGLAGINEALYEAARVDGANAVSVFFKITLPHLLPSLYGILVISFLSAFKVFREAYLVAGDYPHASIYLLQHLFNNWFRELSMDKLSAGAVIVAAVSLLIVAALRILWDREA